MCVCVGHIYYPGEGAFMFMTLGGGTQGSARHQGGDNLITADYVHRVPVLMNDNVISALII